MIHLIYNFFIQLLNKFIKKVIISQYQRTKQLERDVQILIFFFFGNFFHEDNNWIINDHFFVFSSLFFVGRFHTSKLGSKVSKIQNMNLNTNETEKGKREWTRDRLCSQQGPSQQTLFSSHCQCQLPPQSPTNQSLNSNIYQCLFFNIFISFLLKFNILINLDRHLIIPLCKPSDPFNWGQRLFLILKTYLSPPPSRATCNSLSLSFSLCNSWAWEIIAESVLHH